QLERLGYALAGHQCLRRLLGRGSDLSVLVRGILVLLQRVGEGTLVQLFHLPLPLFLQEDLLLCLLPYPDALVVTCTDEEVTAAADGDGPHLTVVSVESLDLLKFVAVPVPYGAVLAAAEEVMTVAVGVV